MKKLLLILFPFLLSAQSVWYVDINATGLDNGTSWTNAWTNFNENNADGVDWSIIGDGDTIYVSGGTDSTLYFKTGGQRSVEFKAIDSTLFSPQVIIRPSWEAGHNGKVVFVMGDSGQDYMFLSENLHGLRLENFTAFMRDGEIVGGGGFYGNNITLYGWHYRGGDGGGGMKIDGNNAIYDSCLFERNENEYPVDTDLFGHNNTYSYTHQTTGSVIVKNCTFIYRNGYTFDECTGAGNVTVGSNYVTDSGLNMATNYHVYNGVGTMVRITDDTSVVYNDWKYLHITSNNATTFYGTWQDYYGNSCAPPPSGVAYIMEGSHRDGAQFGNIGRPAYINDSTTYIVFANNLIIDTNPRGSGWNKMLYSYTPELSYAFYCYNNIIVSRKDYSSNRNIGIEGRPEYTDPIPANYYSSKFIFNNTIITKGAVNALQNGNRFLTIYPYDTLFVKNNLFIADSGINDGIFNIDFYEGDGVTDFNYNYYALQGGVQEPWTWYNNNYRSYSYWISTVNFDANSAFHPNTDATFADKYGLDLADYYTEAGRDSAVDLSTFALRLPPNAPPIDKDILGNDRTGSWDIGALEYTGASPVDSLPNAFTFTDITGATRSTLYTSNGVTLAGFDSAYAYASGNVYTINAGSDLTGYTRVFPNDVLRLKLTSSANYSTGVSSTLSVGGVTDTYTVTTGSMPINPSGVKIFKGADGKILRDSTGKIIKK